ncbi:hypothetical protein ACIBSV_49665 [Embleya sp. NPDC050154]|uniref:hypothetical protein n=1 Tax=Embleya sp. NPDC050154 TaxID=3363988 RepID=UPI0037A0AAFE
MNDEFPEHPAYAIVSGLLDYAVLTNPFPLQASPPTGDPTIARLDMVASAPPGDPVACSRIEIALPIGTSEQSLVDTADGIRPLPPAGWQGAVASTATTATITFTPPGGSFVFDEDGVAASIAGLRINRAPGNATLRITEHPVAVKSPIELVLAKQPYRPPVPAGSPNRFSARRWAGPTTLSTTPATQVRAGQQVTLTWQHRTGVQRFLFTRPLNGNVGAPGKDVTQDSRYDSAPVVRPTTFTLRTTVVATGEVMYDTVTVTVDTPTFAELFVSGPLGAGASGTVTFPDVVTVAGSLTVDGAVTARAGLTSTQTFETRNKLTAQQGITVNGPATAGGTSNVPRGEVQAGGITTNRVTAKKTVKIFGSVGKVTSDTGMLPATIGGRTDRLLLGYVQRSTTYQYQSITFKVGAREAGCGVKNNAHIEDAVFLPLRADEQATWKTSGAIALYSGASRFVLAAFGDNSTS